MTRFIVLMLALALPAVSFADDAQEINRYVLTNAGLAKYVAAVENLRPLAAQVSSCDSEGDDGGGSISAAAARIDGVPAAKAAIASAGLTTREYLVFSFALLQAAMAAWAQEQGGSLPAGVSQANVNFFKANKAKIDSIAPLDDGCDDSRDEE